jgi:hypothetical protein
MIIEFLRIKHANAKWHKNQACVNVGILLEVEDAGSSYVG